MPISRWVPAPGLFNDSTDYAARGNWYTGNLIRFREKYVEKIGGWTPSTFTAVQGTIRDLHSWQDLVGNAQLSIGTNLKYYVSTNGSIIDITPIRQTDSLGSNPFMSVSNGSPTITVTDIGHGANINDFVTFSGVVGSVGGISGSVFNKQFQITNLIGPDSYQINAGVNASSVGSGGGAAVMAAYQIPTGLADRQGGYGWGAGVWGSGTWGGSSSTIAYGDQLRVWSSDTFGEDLVFNYYGGPIFYWYANSASPGINLTTILGASDVPIVANCVMVSPSSRQIFAFGTNPIGSTTQDPLYIRWSDEEDAAMWTPDITNAAGSLYLSCGSQIYTAKIATGQILVWTESALHSIIFVGGDLVYGTQIISPNIDILGPNAVVSVGDFAMWMGRENFYMYNGSLITMPCTVRQAIFSNINLEQAWKVYGGSNGIFREIWFFYPSSTSTENDSYVIYNYVDNSWYFGAGNMPRTAWADRGVSNYPQGASTDGFVYYHEAAIDDNSTIPATPLPSFVQSGPIEWEDGDKLVYLQKIIPDITFQDSTISSPSVTFTVQGRDYNGGPLFDPDINPVTKTSSTPVEQYTTKIDTRIRGRNFTFQCASNNSQLGVFWRLGIQRFDMQPDGRR